MTCIRENYHVILKKGTIMKIVRLCRNGNVRFDKKTFVLNAAIGKPFGTIWEVKSGQVVPVESSQLPSVEIAKSGDDNRDLKDDTHSQKLQRDDIASLKDQGVTGEGIIEQLVDNSASFENKTSYSQAKYLKKKMERHLTRFTICRPSLRLITEIHWRRTPSPKLIHLRPDTMAQMLTYTNIQSGSKVIIIENCQGLLVAAALQRLGGKGHVVHLHSEDIPVITAEESLDFPEEYKNIIMRMPLQSFYKVLKTEEKPEDPESTNEAKEAKGETVTANATEGKDIQTKHTETVTHSQADKFTREETVVINKPHAPQAEPITDLQANEAPESQIVVTRSEAEETTHTKGESSRGRKRKYPLNAERVQRRMERQENNQKIANLMKGKEMDALIIACRFRPVAILTHLLEYLAPSRQFVVYSNATEPLVECYSQLKDTGGVINMQLTETWLREYQVLEDRTHPLVNMSGTSGYILTGTKVVNG